MDEILQTQAEPWPRTQGKVRDLFDLGDRLVLVATDRISAFDWVFPNGIADKGKILTGISQFWFDFLGVPHHLLSTSLADFPEPFRHRPEIFAGRSMLARKVKIVPIECVVRGYLAGSGWKEYRQNGRVCGIPLPSGLRESDRLPEPIFTPATKATSGHDENISHSQMEALVGAARTEELRRRSLELYAKACQHAKSRGLILADTKFEFGESPEGELVLADEVLTPDSSRYWPADTYSPGGPQQSFDKQFVRDWLESIGFDKNSPPPPLPQDVREKTRDKYLQAFERIVGSPFADYLRGCDSH